MILLIDNYDSFVHNLARYFQRLGQQTTVLRNDQLSLRDVPRLSPRAIVLSPGPCTPREAGISLDLVRQYWNQYPMLGVCLGHQTIGAAFGAHVVRAPQPMHGRTSQIHHGGTALFHAVPNPFRACRYHSLMLAREGLPADLLASATAEDGVLMAVQHRAAPVFGVQFHPESVLTEHGYRLLANFLRSARLEANDAADLFAQEVTVEVRRTPPLPASPVTF